MSRWAWDFSWPILSPDGILTGCSKTFLSSGQWEGRLIYLQGRPRPAPHLMLFAFLRPQVETTATQAGGLQITKCLEQQVVIHSQFHFTMHQTQSERRSLLLKSLPFLLFLVQKWLLPSVLLWKSGTGGRDNGKCLISSLPVSRCYSLQQPADVWVFGSRSGGPPCEKWVMRCAGVLACYLRD